MMSAISMLLRMLEGLALSVLAILVGVLFIVGASVYGFLKLVQIIVMTLIVYVIFGKSKGEV